MELKFGNSESQTTITTNVDADNYYPLIKEKLSEIGFTSFYERLNYFDNHIFVDYGSHNNFFYIYGTKEELKEFEANTLYGDSNE